MIEAHKQNDELKTKAILQDNKIQNYFKSKLTKSHSIQEFNMVPIKFNRNQVIY